MTLPTPTATLFGATGFIGRYVTRRLAARGVVIRVASRTPRKANFLKPMGTVGQIVPVAYNPADPDSVAAAVDDSSLVINFVGILAETGGARFDAIQGDLPGYVAQAAAAAGSRAMVQISAIGADAESPSAYARSKAKGEQAVHAAYPKATLLRPSIVFGPEDQFFNRFADMALISPALPLIGGGKTRFQPVYVGDVADAVIAAVEQPDAAGRIYELGGPEVLSFEALMRYMLTTIRRDRLLAPVPWKLAEIQAAVLEKLPGKLLTRDQVELLKTDNVVSGTLPGLADLGIAPTPLQAVVPEYLERYRPGGRFAEAPKAAV